MPIYTNYPEKVQHFLTTLTPKQIEQYHECITLDTQLTNEYINHTLKDHFVTNTEQHFTQDDFKLLMNTIRRTALEGARIFIKNYLGFPKHCPPPTKEYHKSYIKAIATISDNTDKIVEAIAKISPYGKELIKSRVYQLLLTTLRTFDPEDPWFEWGVTKPPGDTK